MKQLELTLSRKETKEEKRKTRKERLKFLIEQNPNIPDFNNWFYEANKERFLWKDQPLSKKEGWCRYRILVENGFWENS